jgi:hypothetical protein
MGRMKVFVVHCRLFSSLDAYGGVLDASIVGGRDVPHEMLCLIVDCVLTGVRCRVRECFIPVSIPAWMHSSMEAPWMLQIPDASIPTRLSIYCNMMCVLHHHCTHARTRTTHPHSHHTRTPHTYRV